MNWPCCITAYTTLIIVGAITQNVVEYSVHPAGSGFLLTRSSAESDEKIAFLTTASNTDNYEVNAIIGPLARRVYFSGKRDLSEDPIHVVVHVFNAEVEEDTKTVHFLCHANKLKKTFETNTVTQICCTISVNTTFSHEFTSCILELSRSLDTAVCHAFIKLPTVLWKQKSAPIITISYTTFRLKHESRNGNTSSINQECSLQAGLSLRNFVTLPAATVVRSVPDAIREIGRSLLLQVPRRELRINEEFVVPVRLKRGDDVSDFTLRCEVPANSYVEFVRVIWPGGLKTTKESDVEFNVPFSSGAPYVHSEGGHKNVWDIFHRSIISQKRNVTEIVARFREDLARSEPASSYSPAAEVYKLLFRVNRSPAGSPGRVAPRIFWSLVSLTRRNSADRAVGGSPIVTRLNIESSELKYLAMVLQTSALVNLAALTGRPTKHPVWVYGLTHDGQLIDVTERATCHTGDDAVIHFANDSCSKLGFSGAELDGSPGLPLVAKLDGRSATTTLLVWFPKPPALRLMVGQETSGDSSSFGEPGTNTLIRLKRVTTEGKSHAALDYALRWNAPHQPGNTTERNSETFFQHLPIRVLARFILAGSVLYDKDVLGGKSDQYVDVTMYTAHRLRVVVDKTAENNGSNTPAELVVLRENDRLQSKETNDASNGGTWKSTPEHPSPASTQVWVMGNHPGQIKLCLDPIDPAELRESIPPGLEKQLKDQQQKSLANASEQKHWLHSSEPSIRMTVQVTEETSVWPVGMSAQFVTDLSLELRQSVDPNLAWDVRQPNPFHEHSNLQGNENLLPLTSGLYAVRADLLGGRVMHSGTIHKSFGHESSLDSSDHLLKNQLHATNRNNGTYASAPRSNSATKSGILVVWIHLSDGSTILWHHMVELYKAMNRKMPFKLSISNIHPELFEVTGPSIAFDERKRRRRDASFGFWDRQLQSNSKENWFTRPTNQIRLGQKTLRYSSQMHFFPDSVQYDESYLSSSGNRLMSDATTGTTWFGPTVRILRDGLSFTGDFLEMGLLSSSGELLVPKLRLPAAIEASKLTNDDQIPREMLSSENRGNPNTVEPRGTAQVLGLPTGYSFPQRKDNHIEDRTGQTASNMKTKTGEVEKVKHGLMAFKDAPGYRGHQVGSERTTHDNENSELSRKQSYAAPLDEKSLSDQNEESNVFPLDSHQRDQNNLGAQPDAIGAARPVLEMSMYILLGLFALVGLVFAVNCGAAVARYRWERNNQRRSAHSGELGHPGSSTDQSPAIRENIAEEGTDNLLEAKYKPIVSKGASDNVLERCKRMILPHRTKHKPLLHRDNNWVWLSREKAAAVIGGTDQPMLSNTPGNLTSPNSPVMTSSEKELQKSTGGESERRRIARSQSYGNRHGHTTAVLSIGEADMLLMQSPYRKAAWEDSLRPETTRLETYVDQDLHTTQELKRPTPKPRSPWNIEGPRAIDTLEVHTLGRPSRRHTTGTLMHRNYQGQECSIRIISNPLSNQNGDSKSKLSHHNNHELSSTSNSAEHSMQCDNQSWRYDPNQMLSGSASASMRRRHTYNVTNNNCGPIATPVGLLGSARSPHCYEHRNTLTGTIQSPMFPPPNHPAPPIPTGQFTAAHGDELNHEVIMCRSWMRPKSINQATHLRFINEFSSHCSPMQEYSSPWHTCRVRPIDKPCSAKPKVVNHETAVPIKERFKVLDQLRESRELGPIESPSQPGGCAPYPPVRTTSRAVNCHTLETRVGARKSRSAPNHRPMSLPQAFQISNELYSILAGNSSNSASILFDSHTKLNQIDPQRHLKSNPSEESLWWYHPVRQPKRRKRGQNRKQSDTATTPTTGETSRVERSYPTMGVSNRVESSETLNYACPASCECDGTGNCPERIATSRAPHTHVQSPCLPGTDSAQHNLSSVSDLDWDKELLALSHDRLVAYFAGMKESMA